MNKQGTNQQISNAVIQWKRKNSKDTNKVKTCNVRERINDGRDK